MEGVKFPKKNFFFSLVRRGKRKKRVGFKLAPDYMFPKGGGGGRLPLHIHMIKRKAHGLWDKKPDEGAEKKNCSFGHYFSAPPLIPPRDHGKGVLGVEYWGRVDSLASLSLIIPILPTFRYFFLRM